MMLRSRLVIVGLAVLLIGLVGLFPARVAYHWVSPPGVAIAGIEGTAWSGHAREARVAGVYLRNINWRMRPLAIFTGRVAYAVEADAESGFAAADVALGIGGSAAIKNLTASLSLQGLQQIVGMPGLDGAASLQFEYLEFENGLPVAANGVLEIAALRAPLVHQSTLGGFRAEFFTQDTGIVASVEDVNAVVDLAGSLSLGSDGSYQFIGQVAPMENTPSELRDQMRFLGTPNERGNYEVRLEGQL
jgi:general secretion pathway protein N